MPLQTIPLLHQGRPTGTGVPAWVCACGLVSLYTGDAEADARNALCPTCHNYCAICSRLTCHCGEH
jgi:hypothetical protein